MVLHGIILSLATRAKKANYQPPSLYQARVGLTSTRSSGKQKLRFADMLYLTSGVALCFYESCLISE